MQVFGIIVTGTIADKLEASVGSSSYCAFGLDISKFESPDTTAGDSRACNYGIGVGALTLVVGLVLILLDALTTMVGLGGGGMAKIAAIGDLVASAILSLLWVVGFIYLTDKWAESTPKSNDTYFPDDVESAAGAAIAFSFFSAGIWVRMITD